MQQVDLRPCCYVCKVFDYSKWLAFMGTKGSFICVDCVDNSPNRDQLVLALTNNKTAFKVALNIIDYYPELC